MSALHALSLISIFWAIIHTLDYLWKPTAASVLPTVSFHVKPSITVALNKFHLRIQTEAFNAQHDSVVKRLNHRREKGLRRCISLFYDMGVVVGIFGMCIGLGTLFWLTGSSVLRIFQKLPSRAIVKRDMDQNPENFIQPIIPGVTVPWDHLPLILVAVFVCQIIHEAGHAIAGALYSVPLRSSGVSLTLVMPSAFVSFASASMHALEPMAKARIISAGPWHNLVLWACFLALGKTGLGTAILSLGWKDLSMDGRIVIALDDDSPLNSVLSVGSIITALDDVSLAGGEDRWSEYLHKSFDDIPWYGWCVPQQDSGDRSCCNDAPHPTLDHLCFDSFGAPSKTCLNPIPILSSLNPRCHLETDCDPNALCVRPSSSASILRLVVKGKSLILWSGPRHEIWEQGTDTSPVSGSSP
ncbi:hypothetical protein BDP27DRAFT_1322026 [Rhodocollybia butyracea]|uniref:Endopeptidase S2P n=1 Tax=Rhodocollybia butyracea TaxID=206335 RepID=A0A9P5UA34_9AGAR|nr:hypothetical protein BDP27DRAFT_1322026 [Rhodocollybia butyracea]